MFPPPPNLHKGIPLAKPLPSAGCSVRIMAEDVGFLLGRFEAGFSCVGKYNFGGAGHTGDLRIKDDLRTSCQDFEDDLS